MNLLLGISIVLRLVALSVLGAYVGRAICALVLRLTRLESPSPRQPRSRQKPISKTSWSSWIPLLGPLLQADPRNKRIRQASVELIAGLLFALLYFWEVHRMALLPALPPVAPIGEGVSLSLHVLLFAHLVLVAAMLAASLVDIDERIIPDLITIPGTLLGLTIAGLYPWALLPTGATQGPAGIVEQIAFLRVSSPNPWPAVLGGSPRVEALLIALACYWTWCFALLPRRWRGRHGWRRALAILLARIAREPFSRLVGILAIAGTLVIAGGWLRGGLYWQGLTSALVGMAVGGGTVWIVRILGSAVLDREAMGFGDVTLMAMIGAYVGWQATLVVFFIAPLFALLWGVVQLILKRGSEIPYGPFLCLATLAVILRWRPLWEYLEPVFAIPWLVPAALVVCMLLMAILLGLMRLVQTVLFGGGRAV